MAVLLMLVIMLTIGIAAVLIWLVTMPFRMRNRLVLGPAPEPTVTDAETKAPVEVAS
jgi:spermidine/putrescine transport system permease protein